jgi:CRISPR-associated protein Csm2
MNEMEKIITNDETGGELVSYAQQLAERLVRDQLTRGQMRIVFSEMRQIEADWNSAEREKKDTSEAQRRLRLLQPKLAYQKERTPALAALSSALTDGIDVVFKATDAAERGKRFRYLMQFLEAVLAYHRANGGRN